MYHVSAQGVDERIINVHYYYYYYNNVGFLSLSMLLSDPPKWQGNHQADCSHFAMKMNTWRQWKKLIYL